MKEIKITGKQSVSNLRGLANIISNVSQYIYQNVVCFFSLLVIGYITFLNFVSTASFYQWETTTYLDDSFLLNSIYCILFVLCLMLIKKNLVTSRILKLLENDKYYKNVERLILFIIFMLSVIWAVSTQIIPGVDEYEVMLYAQEFIHGDYTQLEYSGYFYMYSGNRGLLLFEVLFSLAFGENNYLAFSLLNCIAIVYICKESVEIGKELGLSRSWRILILIIELCFTPLEVYSYYVYGNLLGMAFAFASIKYVFHFIRSNKWSDALKSATMISIGIFFKSNMLIYFVAIILWVIFSALKERRASYLVLPVLMVIGYKFVNTAPTLLLESITGIELNSPASIFSWFAMGLQDCDLAPGWWNGYNRQSYYDANCITSVQKQNAILNIQDRISYFQKNPQYALDFFVKKTDSTWANPTFQCLETVRNGTNITLPKWADYILNNRLAQKYLTDYLNVIVTILLFGCLLGLILNYRRNSYFNALVLPMITVGGFLFLLISETKARYAFMYFVNLIPFSIMGYSTLLKYLSSLLSNNKQVAKMRIITKVIYKLKKLIVPILELAIVIVICCKIYVSFGYAYKLNQQTETYHLNLTQDMS